MTDPQAAAEEPKPEGLFGAVAVIVAIAAVFGVAVSIIGLKFQGFEARQLFDETFGHVEQLPFDFQYAGGTATAGKQRWVRLQRPAAAPPLDPGFELPEVVLLGRFSGPTAAKRQFETGFERGAESIAKRRREWEENPAEKGDWFARVASGVVQWGGLETDYLQLRSYGRDGSRRDLLRVDVSYGQTGQVLVAHWPEEQLDQVQLEAIVPFLSVLRFEEGAAEAGEAEAAAEAAAGSPAE
ncbi:MAG: hypothetical protein ACYS26_05265 [Planctomycetota bacterium]|jgi:hypothetical protein